ncbi:MAG: DNA translocase FtsK [Bacteroidetes bacterium]|nr:DNA translocase FtsK [Bacteroidota bacterium]
MTKLKMATKSKGKITPAQKMKLEKESKVTMKEVVRDERTHKILGAVSILVSLFLFIAFTSYLFTWQNDQSLVFQSGSGIFSTDGVKVHNLLGVLGAYSSYSLIDNGFGVASFLISTFFFVWGINLLFGKKVFNTGRNIKYVIGGLLVLSLTLAFIFQNSTFSWGGAVGNMMSAWLIKILGNWGTGILLVVVFGSYLIWQFNPTFKLPEKKEKGLLEEEPALKTNEFFDEEDVHHLMPLMKSDVESENLPPQPMKKNVAVKMPVQDHTDQDDLLDITLTEKDIAPDESPTIVELKTTPDSKPVKDIASPDLEIKDTSEVEETTTENVTVQKDYEPTLDLRDYQYPSLELLETHGSEKIVHDPNELEANKNQILNTLKNYDIHIQRISATVGPTVTLYEIVPAPGIRISKIKNLEDDIALSLAALGIRIIAPIPGKGTIGIEVPNVRKSIVSMKTLLSSEKFQNNTFSLPIAIGKKIDNENFIVDLASMPHLLMAGATGQGKSVGINTILVSLLYKKHPSQLKLVLVDPKKVELSLYRVIEKHFLAKLPGEEESIITDTKKVVYTLNALCIEMDNRYDLLKEAGCRNIREYNEKFIKRKLNPLKGHQFLPFIVLVVDEFADLIMTAGKEIELPIARLAQLARAVGIHLIIATQRPSVNIITGTIKANFPARIAFKVSSKIDSRTILDVGGAEQLIGKGDMLISYNGDITRLQCAFVDTPEVENLCEFIGDQRGYPDAFLLPEYVDEKELEGKDVDMGDRDALFEDAARLIVQNQIGSTSLLQRRMKLGYNRAGRLMDQLEIAGIVGKNQGSKAREVLIHSENELQEILNNYL